MAKTIIRVTHATTGEKLAEGPKGWGITPFEGNLYIQHKYLLTDKLKVNFIPGLCFYKFLYVWMDLDVGNGQKSKMIGWKYFLPNPLFPFIWYRVGLPRVHPELLVEEFEISEEADEPAQSGSGTVSGR
ncbi:MAG: hypothetical protein AB7W16_28505 [Candidatus Obscuribacterales bacterium]